jgi:hypothetical protein
VTVWILTYSAIYVTVLSVLPVEVAPLTVGVEELTWTLSDNAEEVDHLAMEMELGLGDALGMSLSEV